MNCAVHTDRDATGYCRNCGKALCPECTREVRGALYCEDCLAGLLSAPLGTAGAHPGAVPDTSQTNPGLAATLGFVPGLGAVYNGEYVKALVQVLVFGGLIAAISSDIPGVYVAFLSILLACFYCYMPIDSYRVSKARQLGQAEPGPIVDGKTGRPIGAFLLILIGVLFLLSNFGLLQADWFGKVWPIGLIALGGWLVWDRTRNNA
ncbi:MAG TPA: B-box zinc finger protein [Candidatus Acidoferrum sp.]|nr:B-box zinc finger protein [Candidatus Acidoferrum sp.]